MVTVIDKKIRELRHYQWKIETGFKFSDDSFYFRCGTLPHETVFDVKQWMVNELNNHELNDETRLFIVEIFFLKLTVLN